MTREVAGVLLILVETAFTQVTIHKLNGIAVQAAASPKHPATPG